MLIERLIFSISVLEEELSRVREEREHQVRQLRGKMEQNAQSLQHQFSIQEAKVRYVDISTRLH